MNQTRTADGPSLISGLSGIISSYDAILCDVWGVIHNGRESFAAACDALSRAQSEAGVPVVLVSNAPRPSRDVVPQLHALMVPDHAWAGFVTSGDATVAELRRRAPGPVWTIGPERDEPLYGGLDLIRADVHAASFISVTGLFDDVTETPEDYREALTIAAARDLPLVCANPDRVVQRGDKMIYCAGALADLYETLGGKAVMAGKPYSPIYELALAEVAKLLDRPADRRRILAIGDGLITDVAGAQGQAIDCLFVTDGIHAGDVRDADGEVSLDRIRSLLQAQGLVAAHAIPHLVW
jgi:HAD superfamily hydrolase (TIGR01459 family)